MSIKIAPSLLAADFSRLAREVRSVEEGADMLHWDIMDGHFVPNLSFGPMAVKWMRDKTELPFSVHLMLENPEDFIEKFADSGTDVLFVHVEVLDDLRRVLRKIRSLGMNAGIVLRPGTRVEDFDYIFDEIDDVMIMTVEPGFGGQELKPEVVPKIRKTRRIIDDRGLDVEVSVDGGVNEQTAQTVVDAGADTLIMGSAIFDEDRSFSIRELKNRFNG